MSQGVCGAKVLLERDATHCRGDEHFSPCVEVARVLDCARKRLTDQADAFECNTVTQWMKCRRSVGLDAMRQRIGSSRSRQLGRQIDGQLRVEDYQSRQQRWMEDDAL